MMPRLDSRNYLNAVLTVIAVLIAIGLLQDTRLPLVASTAQAQDFSGTNSAVSGSRRADTRAAVMEPGDNGNLPKQADPLVAAALQECAGASREIALAIRELSKSVDSVGTAVQAMGARAAAGSGTAAVATPEPAREPIQIGVQ